MRRAAEKLALVAFVALVLSGGACILGPKQDDPADQTGADAGTVEDTSKANTDGALYSDTGTYTPGADASADGPGPPGDRCGDDDAGDAGDGDAREAGCDAADADGGDAPGEGGTGG